MANTIKFKRGSGSDPGTSDLSVGEIAIRTDTAKIFTKNDGGSVVEISGGVEDGDITTSKIADDAVTYAKIQNVSATNRLLGRDSSGAGIIEEIAPSAVRTMLGLAASATTDTTNASNISSGTLAAARVATLNQDTTGNAATATALETARTIAGVSFDGTSNISLNNNAITNGAGYITATLTNEQVQDIVGAMVSGNTETGISVSYADGDGTLDFVVASQTDENFTTTLKNKLDGIAANAIDGSSLNASNISSGTVNTARLPNTYTKAASVTVQATGSGNDIKLDAADHIIFEAGEEEDGGIYFRGNSGVDSYRFAKGGQHSIEGFLSFESLSTDRTFTFPDTTGTLALTSDIPTNNNQLSNGAGYITATLTNEQVQDIVGAMVTGNTESGITVTYQDSDGTLDFSVASQTGSLNASNLSSGTIPDARFPSTLPAVDGSNLTGISAGATGGGSDEIFYENGQTVTTNYTITNGKNAMSAGPITINSGVTVTVGSGETLTIV